MPTQPLKQHDPDLATRLQPGVGLFNACRFWDAHEAWEDVWRDPATYEADRRFVQGLIQVAAALHHAANTNPRGLDLLRARAMHKLTPYMPGHGGLDIARLGQAIGNADITDPSTLAVQLRHAADTA